MRVPIGTGGVDDLLVYCAARFFRTSCMISCMACFARAHWCVFILFISPIEPLLALLEQFNTHTLFLVNEYVSSDFLSSPTQG